MSETLSDDFDRNYALFIEEAMATGCVWGLESEEGFAVCASVVNEEQDVMPLWSQPEYAQAHVEGEWASYKVVPIALEELLDDWLPGMHEDLALVGPNWNAEMQGDEIEPLDLLEDFDQHMED
ncbi:MAG: DUF2750 domain-containing protein [Cellvibrionaceae bacterium]|nr:DUF2750 domain-containing protein [Cellvibrionaceae bacterium]